MKVKVDSFSNIHTVVVKEGPTTIKVEVYGDEQVRELAKQFREVADALDGEKQ